MDEPEMAQLEQRLRRSVVGHRPPAPGALARFIDTVPARQPSRGETGWRQTRRLTRRGIFALATAAAVVVAIVASAAIMAVRTSQTGRSSGDGWSWQQADGTIVGGPYQVARGFVGTCRTSLQSEPSLCTSPDGLHWTTPADPAIVSVEGGGQFEPLQMVKYGGVYLAETLSDTVREAAPTPTATPTPCLSPSGCYSPGAVSQVELWRSGNGIHWSRVDSAAFSGLSLAGLGAIPGGFIVVAASTPEESGWALTSPDGLNWSRSSQLPVQPGTSGSEGEAAFFVSGTSSPNGAWRTIDGKEWTRLDLPAGAYTLGSVSAVPSGGYVGLGVGVSSPSGMPGYSILRSQDGSTWRVDPGDLRGTLIGLCGVGNRLVASVVPDPLTAETPLTSLRVWESLDWGQTWQPLLDPTGQQMSGTAFSMGDGLAIETPNASNAPELTWVGTLTATTVPAQSSTARPVSMAVTALASAAPSTAVGPTAIPPGAGDPCAPEPSAGAARLIPDLDGMTGWEGVSWGGGNANVSCIAGSGQVKTTFAVVFTCEAPGTLRVSLLDLSLDASVGVEQRTIGGTDVNCPIATPAVVWEVTDLTASHTGHAVQLMVTTPYYGNYSWLVQTTGS